MFLSEIIYNHYIIGTTGTNSTSRTTYRGCVQRGFCQRPSNNSIISCVDCDKDKCNDATGLSASIATMVTTVAGVLIVSRF